MHIAFIGGTRFIGHHAAALAVERGHTVTVVHRGEHPSEVAGARDVLADRSDPEALIAALRAAEPDAVIDTRSMTRPQAELAALALKILKVPCVVLSSMDVYAAFGRVLGREGPEPELPIGESSPLTVPFPYRGLDHPAGDDYDKKEVEAVFREATADGLVGATVLRLPAVYGPRDPNRRFGFVVDRLLVGQRAFPCQDGARWRWTHAHVRNVAHACVLAAEKGPSGYAVFNIGERETPTMRERVEALAKCLDERVEWQEVEALPDELRMLGRWENDVVVSSEAIREALGYEELLGEAERTRDLVQALSATATNVRA